MPGVSRALGVTAALLAVLIALATASCTSSTIPPQSEPQPGRQAGARSGALQEVPLPEGVTAYVDQSRLERESRTLFVRLVNDADRRLLVTRAEISSPRFADVTWTGERSFQNEADLEFELPPASCGAGSPHRSG